MPNQPITLTASTTLRRKTHANTLVIMDNATGFTVTLPSALGYGDIYTIYVKTTVSSGSHVIQVGNTTDVMNGGFGMATDVAGVTFPLAASDDTITMGGSTTGGLAGTFLTFTDAKAGFWLVGGHINTSGAEADPASAAV